MSVNHRYHTEVEQERLLAMVRQFRSLEARRDAAWIDLLRRSGMRIGEFSKLDVKRARLAIERGWLFLPAEHRKGKKQDHSIFVTEPMRKALEQLLVLQLAAGGTGADDEPLIYSRKGLRMSIRGYQDRYKHWCGRAGIDGSPHWMRHTRAMNIMRRTTSKDPRGLVQAALGHTDISSSGIYTRTSKEDVARHLGEIDNGRARRRDMRKIVEGRV